MKVAPLAVAALTACGLTACSSPRPTPAAGRRADATAQDAPMADLSTRLILTPSGDRWSIAFELRNGTAAAIARTYVEPLLAFSLAVTSRDGRDVAVQQPAIDLPSRDPGGLCPVVWSVTLLTPWFPAISEQLELLDGELEVRVVGRHCKDDSEQLFVWRYSLDGAPLPLRPERA